MKRHARLAMRNNGGETARPGLPGFATLAVLWTIAVVALVLGSLQAASFREAAGGREAVAKVRAYWAARAGIEAQIARLTQNTLSPDPSSALTITTDLESAASGTLANAVFSVQHFEDGRTVDGAADAHALLNVNTLETQDLLTLDGMDETVAGSIVSWVRGEPSGDSAEATSDSGAYLSLRYPYKPREAAARSLRELELVVGVTPQALRGEDWNLNGRLDPGENDGDGAAPMDNSDGKLDAGWSQYLTASSELGGMAASGKARLDLTSANLSDIAQRLRVDSEQARVISKHAQSGDLSDFVRSDLSQLDAQSATNLSGQSSSQVSNLTRDQLRTLLDEAIVGDPPSVLPRSGRLNINTVTRQTLERQTRITPDQAEAIMQARQSRPGGFVSLPDLLEVAGIDRPALADLMDVIDVRSNVYVASSKGRDSATGIEVEIVAELDRSTIPVVIKDLVVR